MNTTRQSYTDYLIIWWTKNSKWQREWTNSIKKLHYTKLRIEEWESVHYSCKQNEVKFSNFTIEHTRMIHRHLI